MKSLILVCLSVLLLVSCYEEEKPSPWCPLAQIGTTVVASKIVEKIGTCDASIITTKVLEAMKCPTSLFGEKALDFSIMKEVCPVILGVLGDIVGTAGALELKCDPVIISNLIQDTNACNLLFPVKP